MNGEGEIMEMPAEADISDGIPNPYIGKVRRETMKAVVNKDAHGVSCRLPIISWQLRNIPKMSL